MRKMRWFFLNAIAVLLAINLGSVKIYESSILNRDAERESEKAWDKKIQSDFQNNQNAMEEACDWLVQMSPTEDVAVRIDENDGVVISILDYSQQFSKTIKNEAAMSALKKNKTIEMTFQQLLVGDNSIADAIYKIGFKFSFAAVRVDNLQETIRQEYVYTKYIHEKNMNGDDGVDLRLSPDWYYFAMVLSCDEE
jgi:hypothetical protein